MANIKQNAVIKAQANKPHVSPLVLGVKNLIGSDGIKQKFNEMLGKKAPGFLSSIVTVAGSKAMASITDAMSVISAASVAASLDLPVNPSLGWAWIVPYKGQASFQLGWKGYVQLAQRSGLYKGMDVTEVYEGEIKSYDRFTGTVERGERVSDKVVGYYAWFELLNGFRKEAYWTRDEVIAHVNRYSQAGKSALSKKYGVWYDEFDKMAKKTVFSNLIKTWGPLSIEMQQAAIADEQIIGEDGQPEFVEAESTEGDTVTVDAETGEIVDDHADDDAVLEQSLDAAMGAGK